MKEKYNEYIFNCHCQGDIWNEIHRPYTFDEWLNNNFPENGGIKL